MKKSQVLAAFLIGLACCITLRVLAAPVQVSGDRWLEVRQIVGTVTYHSRQRSQSARKGTRLSAVGDRLSTGSRSKSMLAADTGITFLHVSENTSLRVQQLRKNADGGRFTRLIVDKGQVRLQIRKFTHRSSGFELQTPAGVVGVRGTQFGIGVQPDGKMGVATREGKVVTSAEGKVVAVEGGFQNLTIPGEPPEPAVPLRDDPSVDIRRLSRTRDGKARIAGTIDPVNILSIEGIPQNTDRQGNFDLTVPFSADDRVEIVVTTPLESQARYELIVP